MGRVGSVGLHGCLAKVLKDISQKEDVCSEIQIMVIANGLTVESRPHFLCMLIVVIGNSLLAETAVELVL